MFLCGGFWHTVSGVPASESPGACSAGGSAAAAGRAGAHGAPAPQNLLPDAAMGGLGTCSSVSGRCCQLTSPQQPELHSGKPACPPAKYRVH